MTGGPRDGGAEGGRLRLLGHPAHPPFTHLPIGLWSAAAVADAVALLRSGGPWWTLAAWCLAGGVVAALPAAATGFVEYVALPAEHPAERVVTRHLVAVLLAATFFLVSLLLHRDALAGTGAAPAHPGAAAAFAAAGLAALLAGGWLGGELVYRHGLGVAGGAGSPAGRED